MEDTHTPANDPVATVAPDPVSLPDPIVENPLPAPTDPVLPPSTPEEPVPETPAVPIEPEIPKPALPPAEPTPTPELPVAETPTETPTLPVEAPTPTSIPEPEVTAPAPVPALPEPTLPSASQNGVPAAVLALSDDELRAAATHYLKKNQIAISQKGVQARQEVMRKNLDAIYGYIQAHGSTQIPRLAREFNLSPRLISHYMQILVRQGKIKAEGHASGRRYFI